MNRVCNSFIVLALLFAVLLTVPAQAAWNTAQGNFQRTGYNPASTIDPTRLTKAWTYLHPTHGAMLCDPVEYNGRVFAAFGSFSAFPDEWQAFDINTGAWLWTNQSTSTAGNNRSTPAAVTIGGTDYLYVARGSSGGSAGIRCINAATGVTVFNGSSGGQRIRYSRPALADTNADDTLDIVVAGTEGGTLIAWDALTGAQAWSTELDAGYWIMFGPSTSSDGKVIYCGTWNNPALGDGHGRVHAVDATSGAILGTFDPLIDGAYEDEGYTAPIIYIDDSAVVATGYGVNGISGRVSILDRNCGLLGQGSVDMRAMFAASAVYPDQLSADTIIISPTEGGFFAFAVGIVARSRDIPSMRAGTGGFRYNFFACTDAAYLPESPISVANSPDTHGVAVMNTDVPDAKMYVFPAVSKTGTTNLPYWTKSFGLSATFLQESGNAMVDGVNDSSIVMVTQEGYGLLHAFRNSTIPRARWADATGCFATLNMNVPFAFNGTSTDTVVFYSIGDAAGSYTVAGESVLVAGEVQKAVSNLKIKYTDANPSRREFAERYADALTTTGKDFFMSKQLSAARRILLSDQFPQLPEKSVYANKLRETAVPSGISAPPSWLTVNDLTGGGPVAAGDSALIEVIVNSASLGLGTYNAELHLTVAPDEPDPDLYGGTDVVLPISFVVGFVAEELVISTPTVDKLITNYSALGNDAGIDNFVYNGTNQLFDGTIIIGNSPTTLAMDVFAHVQAGIIPDTSIGVTDLTDSLITYTRYIDNIGLGVRVAQTTKTFIDPEKAGFVLYRLDITNIADSLIPNFAVGIYSDWDVGNSATNQGDMDTVYKVFYEFDVANPNLRFGFMSIPFNTGVKGYELLDNNVYVYPTSDLVNDSVWAIMNRGTFSTTGAGAPDDHCMLLTFSLADLDSGATRTEEFALFGYDSTLVTTDSLANLINGTATAVRERNSQTAQLPKSFELNQNFPNPFNANTQIRFAVPKASHVRLDVFDILGRKVKTLVNENLTAGYKQVIWDGTNQNGDEVASGVYFYRIKSVDFATTKKMVLLK
ncbi:MAG: hypothetical protein A2Z27_00980 [candidate division Zixibacteria bacterium RBG_16_50_21]|nr:MAG: hypothetical protein A2Z27_00980 [candidate division Zixibacteria bacterium RBG_16_50_21]